MNPQPSFSLRVGFPLLLAAAAAPAAAQTLVADLNTTTIGRSGNPGPLTVAGGLGFFVATDQYGDELWRTDGTALGTWRLRDLAPGAASSLPQEPTAVGNLLFFTADVAGYGRELYVTDGSTAGTRLVRDIRATTDLGSDPQGLIAYQGKVYFRADDGVHGPELWTSDGTAAGTTMVVDLFPGSNPGAPADFAVWNGWLWFVGQDGRGREIYRTDGTAAGTTILVDYVPGPGSANPGALCATAGDLFFVASENSGGFELYATDGTAVGTRRVADILPGQAGSYPQQLTPLGSLVVFSANDGSHGAELWRSDGTAPGTFLLGDLDPGTATSMIQEMTPAAGNRVFFAANSGAGRTLFRTDGSVAGTVLVQPALTNVAHLAAAFGGVACAGQTAGTSGRLWLSDGTALGTVPVVGSPLPAFTRPLGSLVLFSASNNPVGRELFASDGVTAWLVQDLAVDYGSSPLGLMTELGGNLFFAPTPPTGWVPWLSNGTASGTYELNLGLGNPSQAVRWRNGVWFVASTPATSFELCVSDGTTLGTSVAFDLLPGTASPAIQDLTPTSNKLFFTAATGAGRELFATDGSLGGTVQFDLAPGSAGALPQEMAAFGNRLVFSANDGVAGREAWISDGSVAGTSLLADLLPGSGSSTPRFFTVLGNRVFFAAVLPGLGTELCVTDGTPAGTGLFADLLPGAASSAPHDLVGCGTLLFFKASTPAGGGVKLFVSDGTVAGTQVVRDISPTIAVVPITDMVGVPGRLFFFADDQVHGRELWTSDGTTAGTVLVRDLMVGFGHGAATGTLTRLPGTAMVLFAGADHDSGLQVWRSDGTPAGTTRQGLMGSRPGSGASNLGLLTAAGNRVFFRASTDSGAGEELWVLPLQGGGAAAVAAYGDAMCPGTLGVDPVISAFGLPQLGNASFGVDVSSAPVATLAVLFLGIGAQDVPFGGCHVLLQGPIVAGPTLLTNAAGWARTTVPIPATAALASTAFFGQYLVLDPVGAFLGTFSLTDGLAIHIGS